MDRFKSDGAKTDGVYAVVGCSNCGTYWLLSDPDAQSSATCPRCGTRHSTPLRRFFESDDHEAARQARARLLAEKHGDDEAFERAGTVSDLESAADEAGMSEREYLEASGLDADRVAEAGDVSRERSGSHDDVVRDALEAGRTTEDGVVDYATDRGVPAGKARDLLERLVERGEVSESRGEYRLL